jgi:hypothetical protein
MDPGKVQRLAYINISQAGYLLLVEKKGLQFLPAVSEDRTEPIGIETGAQGFFSYGLDFGNSIRSTRLTDTQ